MASPVYGIEDPELAKKLVEEYRKARFSGTEEGLKRAEQILQEIRSGRYLKPIEWPVNEEEVENAKREFFVEGGGKPLESPETYDEEEALRQFFVAEGVEPTAVPPTTRPARYSAPEITSLTNRFTPMSDPRRTALLTEPSPTPRPVQTQRPSAIERARIRSRVSRITDRKTEITPPPGTGTPRVMSAPRLTALSTRPPTFFDRIWQLFNKMFRQPTEEERQQYWIDFRR